MKVILLQDVAKIGRRTEVVNVPDGYAQNKLIPKKLAEPATPANLKKISRLHAGNMASKEVEKATFAAAKTSLAAFTPTISTEANEKGHLFKAVSSDDIIASAINGGVTLPKDMLHIDAPIKELGEHSVKLQYDGEEMSFKINVVKK